ncbi:TetR/AcrR family transcriptional regulator [Streptoalloteichus tenebrarius]|uniref:TetR/AcrR family transcriptional regulator n=1 Tax=Streptoalloteichus tenebrarius (strain ATCC 17920 / DSM 40477 / JCM 4838 / CBS 697.72 / NBRC 16177 / NCIMB 11028 / NRRL B-12390 / A12253. 1 / ISP 5477) TaxID=1933 RepID=UPI0020A5BAC6|nr:TetR/AcrR family transcriptional regulator [Streptoalloteichus tenebrarius]BFF04912.1 TetR/AcrR family transcriptional regulator [Streptoalloteichus tenebrarius]
MPAPRPLRRGEAVQRAILDATAQVIEAEGVAGARVADIAARAGVHETSVYRRWGTRANLLLEVLTSQLDRALPLPDTGTTRDDLITFFTALAGFLATPAGSSLIHAALSPSEDEAQFEQARREFWSARLGRAAVLVHRGVERGDLPGGTDAELVLEAIAGPIQLRVLLRNEPVDRGHVTRIVDLVLDGARSPEQSSEASLG